MARKAQVAIQETLETNEDFENYLQTHFDKLICMEVYSEFCGHCLATGQAIRKGKMEIGQDNIAMAKALADTIDALSRFKNKSEPVFLFISKGKLVRAMFGANGIELCRIMEEELRFEQQEKETGIERPKRDIREMLPEEAAKMEEDIKIEQEIREASDRLRILTLAARKKRVCERLARSIRQINFILFWPHCHQAHYDLYEKWDIVNVTVAAKETRQLTEEDVKEVLYMSDVEQNEACIYALLKGEVLVVLFKMFETDDRNFVQVMRHALYEEIPEPKEDVPPEKQLPPIPAYERYATISKTAREVRRERHNLKLQKIREEKEERERLAAEQARLAREAEEDRLREEKKRQEEERMARIQAGLPADPEPEPTVVGEEGVEGEEKEGEDQSSVPEGGIEEEQEKVEEEEEFHSDIEVEGEEYIPPGGLFVPGLYTPPNDLAKANALAFFFPKIVLQHATIESEYLPPHVLVMFHIDKRQDVQEVIEQYPNDILAVGVFVGDDPFNAEHVAYTIKQYNKMERRFRQECHRQRPRPVADVWHRVRAPGPSSCYLLIPHPSDKDRLALMVSRRRSLALLQLAGFNPCYISSDVQSGERDCLALFPVGYGDDYEEEESVKEEEIQEVLPVADEAEPEKKVEERVGEEEDEEEED